MSEIQRLIQECEEIYNDSILALVVATSLLVDATEVFDEAKRQLEQAQLRLINARSLDSNYRDDSPRIKDASSEVVSGVPDSGLHTRDFDATEREVSRAMLGETEEN